MKVLEYGPDYEDNWSIIVSCIWCKSTLEICADDLLVYTKNDYRNNAWEIYYNIQGTLPSEYVDIQVGFKCGACTKSLTVEPKLIPEDILRRVVWKTAPAHTNYVTKKTMPSDSVGYEGCL